MIDRAREFKKTPTVWITTNYEKFFKSWEYQTTWPASWEIYVQVKKHQLELDMEQQTGSKLGKECVKADIVTLLIAGWCEELTHLKRPWWWERLKAGGEGDIRG